MKHRLGSPLRRDRPDRAFPHGAEPEEIQGCFSDIETALQRIERAVSRLKAEAVLLRVEGALTEAPLVPNATPMGAEQAIRPKLVLVGR